MKNPTFLAIPGVITGLLLLLSSSFMIDAANNDSNIYDVPEHTIAPNVTFHFDKGLSYGDLDMEPLQIYKGNCHIGNMPAKHNGYKVQFFFSRDLPSNGRRPLPALLATYTVKGDSDNDIEWEQGESTVRGLNVYHGDHVKAPNFVLNYQAVATSHNDECEGYLSCEVFFELSSPKTEAQFISKFVHYVVDTEI